MIAAYNGRIVSVAGDGLMAEFASVVNAVACAVDLQLTMNKRNLNVDPDRRILFRLGVNLGDVTCDGDAVYGDSVNIAFRLEALAEPGGIMVSRSVKDHIGNKLRIAFEFVGDKNLKNIQRPVAVFRVPVEKIDQSSVAGLQRVCFGESSIGAPGRDDLRLPRFSPAAVNGAGSAAPLDRPPRRPGTGRRRHVAFAAAIIVTALAGPSAAVIQATQSLTDVATTPRPPAHTAQRPSIAVLPFDNLGGSGAQQTFVDGMTRDIITDLSKFSGLLVIAANSTFRYKDRPVQHQLVGAELGVRYVLEGSVQRYFHRVRINAQLVEAATARHVWAERFDRPATDLFAVQNEIAREIVEVVGPIGNGSGKLRGVELARLANTPTDSLRAYDHYLRGVVYQERHTKDDNLRARQAFQEAVTLDPGYAKAIAEIAWTYHTEYYLGWIGDDGAPLMRAEAWAERAVATDPGEPDAFFSLGAVRLAQRRHDEALATLRKAVAMNPNDVDTLMWLGWALTFVGEAEQGLDIMERAIERNPFHPGWYYYDLAWANFVLRHYEQAADVLELRTPKSNHTRLLLAALYAKLDRNEAAALEMAAFRQAEPDYAVETAARTRPFKLQDDLDHYLDALRAAGLPETIKDSG
ncbi:MAG: adenylate/guanylate cyclase domain-containing protein [Geminicoccaceae bacterium]